MVFYYKSEAEVTPVAPPDGGGEQPPLIVWGPGDPRPTNPIAGFNPGTGQWPDTPPTQPPPDLVVGWDPMPSQPIAEPPWGWGNPPPKPEVPDPGRGWKITYGWLPEPVGWFVFALPTGPVPTPSKKR